MKHGVFRPGARRATRKAMSDRAPISVVIPTLNAGSSLSAALASLAPTALGGLIREVVVSDGGSNDATAQIAEDAGARTVSGPAGRGGQLARGASHARGDWLLFLHADTILTADWEDDARALMAQGQGRAGVFTLKFDAAGLAPAIVAAGAMIRTRIFASPYGDQGLLVSRSLYEKIGGYRDMALFEDVDFIDRLVRHKGRRALVVMRSKAVTSAEKYRRDGYLRRVLKNARCLALYRLGAAPEKIAGHYA